MATQKITTGKKVIIGAGIATAVGAILCYLGILPFKCCKKEEEYGGPQPEEGVEYPTDDGGSGFYQPGASGGGKGVPVPLPADYKINTGTQTSEVAAKLIRKQQPVII